MKKVLIVKSTNLFGLSIIAGLGEIGQRLRDN